VKDYTLHVWRETVLVLSVLEASDTTYYTMTVLVSSTNPSKGQNLLERKRVKWNSKREWQSMLNKGHMIIEKQQVMMQIIGMAWFAIGWMGGGMGGAVVTKAGEIRSCNLKRRSRKPDSSSFPSTCFFPASDRMLDAVLAGG
jgi:hypothetical protein